VTTKTPVSNGAGEHRGRRLASQRLRPFRWRRGGVETIVAAVDLLAHFWSRPITARSPAGAEARDLEAETDLRISSDPLREPVRVPGLEEVPDLLDQYERLFVGPGQVHARPMSRFGARTSLSTSAGP